ncbi:MAG: hypothetical protein AAGF83_14435 [Cyanobacteria bacterium P01_G01_bin.67]
MKSDSKNFIVQIINFFLYIHLYKFSSIKSGMFATFSMLAFLLIIHTQFDNEEAIFSNSLESYREEKWVTNPGSFVELPPYGTVDMSKVIIVIPENCSRENALRGKYLADRLVSIDVPVSLRSSISFSQINSMKNYRKVNSVMTGDIPIVLVGSKGKSNPSSREILYEYYLINP